MKQWQPGIQQTICQPAWAFFDSSKAQAAVSQFAGFRMECRKAVGFHAVAASAAANSGYPGLLQAGRKQDGFVLYR
ncbi:MAG: hypothetical protein GXZ05_04075 [Gammaproteobacteria bacterium]|nr:hypothetical protein [Gammaproteobacteria bacterium]